jgi:hypothetical protein
MLGVGHRFGAGQAGQRLVAIAGHEQPGQVLAKPTPLGQRLEGSSKWTAYASSGPGAGGHGNRFVISSSPGRS